MSILLSSTLSSLDQNKLSIITDQFFQTHGVIEFDAMGTSLTANKRFLEDVGYAIEEVKGKHHRLFVSRSEATSDAYLAFWAKLYNGIRIKGAYQYVKKDGGTTQLDICFQPILDDDSNVVRFFFKNLFTS